MVDDKPEGFTGGGAIFRLPDACSRGEGVQDTVRGKNPSQPLTGPVDAQQETATPQLVEAKRCKGERGVSKPAKMKPVKKVGKTSRREKVFVIAFLASFTLGGPLVTYFNNSAADATTYVSASSVNVREVGRNFSYVEKKDVVESRFSFGVDVEATVPDKQRNNNLTLFIKVDEKGEASRRLLSSYGNSLKYRVTDGNGATVSDWEPLKTDNWGKVNVTWNKLLQLDNTEAVNTGTTTVDGVTFTKQYDSASEYNIEIVSTQKAEGALGEKAVSDLLEGAVTVTLVEAPNYQIY